MNRSKSASPCPLYANSCASQPDCLDWHRVVANNFSPSHLVNNVQPNNSYCLVANTWLIEQRLQFFLVATTAGFMVSHPGLGGQTGRGTLTTGHNDDNEEKDDSDNQAHSHLHVLPPHLLPDPVGSTSETLCRHCQVVCLVLKTVETLATFRHFIDVVAHDIDGGIDFLEVRSLARFR